MKAWNEEMSGGLKSLTADSTNLLASRFREDRSTGQTPQKKVWKMPGRWNLVPANREDAIEAGRRSRILSLPPVLRNNDDE